MQDLYAHFRGAEGQLLAHAVLALLQQHDVPTSPANYELWINHLSGLHPDLSRAVEAQLATGAGFGDEVSEALFDRFFANTRLTIEMAETSETVARELSNVVSTLRSAGAEAGAYAATLSAAADNLDAGNPADVRMMMAALAEATREMAVKNRQLSQQMDASSRQVAALQTALQNVKLEALTDSLTGLANRRLFDETLRRRIAERDVDAAPLCLLMCDIDHFKRFNDSWGHPVGDQVIRYIASALRQHVQGDCLAARYGGEEFAVIMPRTGVVDAQATGLEINQTIKSKRLMRRSTGEAIGAVTLSVGVAQYRSGESSATFLARADACLYASKHAGRDRVTSDADYDALNAA